MWLAEWRIRTVQVDVDAVSARGQTDADEAQLDVRHVAVVPCRRVPWTSLHWRHSPPPSATAAVDLSVLPSSLLDNVACRTLNSTTDERPRCHICMLTCRAQPTVTYSCSSLLCVLCVCVHATHHVSSMVQAFRPNMWVTFRTSWTAASTIGLVGRTIKQFISATNQSVDLLFGQRLVGRSMATCSTCCSKPHSRATFPIQVGGIYPSLLTRFKDTKK